MKFCSKCGNELMDEAVICPKCGCMVNGELTPKKKPVATNAQSTSNEEIKPLSIVNFVHSVMVVIALFWLFLSLGIPYIYTGCYSGYYSDYCNTYFYPASGGLTLTLVSAIAALGVGIASTVLSCTRLNTLKGKLNGILRVIVSVLMIIATIILMAQ